MSFSFPSARDWLFKKNICRKTEPATASLMARVSYELRTSLTGIVGYAEFLENRKNEPMMNFTAKIIRESSSCLARASNSYFDLQYLQRGQVRLSKTWFNLSSLLHDLVSLHQPQAIDRSIHLQLICSPAAMAMCICSDPVRMRQVLDALIFNTMQRVETWGAIHIDLSVDKEKKFLVLSVESSMVKADDRKLELERLFWRSNDYQFQLKEGPGVEMALAKALIRLAGYCVTYEVTQHKVSTLQLKVPVT